ncbi:MAG: nitroreductase family deazaflavin-dependent oxidoreductase [Chloroflexi bacterium]|nr:nitroreductase family deazaflavin-dependent oxidoreductase [Chloroflexota bacterium]
MSADRSAPPAPPQSSGQRASGISRPEQAWLFIHRGLDRWLSPLGVWVYRRTRGAITGPWKVDALLLTTRGRRSGKERTVVLQFFPDDEAMIVAAANDGGQSHPGWYFNLASDPAARVQVLGRSISVRAEALPPGEAAAWWQRIVRRSPDYERYARATSRSIPIVRLVPVAPGGEPS